MSINNPYGLNPGWKIDPDGRQDRRPSEVTVRKMTKEEIKKYGAVKGQPIGPVISFIKSEEVKQIREREKMGRGHKLNVNTEDLLRICRDHGTGNAGYAAVAEELGMSWHTAKKKIAERGIVKKLKAESVEFDVGERIKHATDEKCPQCGGATAETNKGKIYCLSTDCRYIKPIISNSHKEHTDNSTVKEYLDSVGNPPIPDSVDDQYKVFIKMNSPIEIPEDFINALREI